MRCAPLALLAAAGLSLVASAEVRLAPLFTDGAVLQRERDLALWGWAAPGETVDLKATWTVGGSAATASATADPRGVWSTTLRTPAAGGPYSLTASGPSGSTTIHDLLIGEVWLCSGQSNMEWPLRESAGGDAAIASANDPQLRLFVVTNAVAARPASTFPAPPTAWRPITSANAANASAVAYHFGRMLRAALDVPVGLVAADWGGTPAEAWTPGEALRPFERFRDALAGLAALDADPAVRATKLAEHAGTWWSRLDELPGAPGRGWASGAANAAPGAAPDPNKWTTITLPASLTADGLDRFDGIVYLRRTVDVPAEWVGKAVALELGPIDDRDEAFVNGALVGGTREDGQWAQPRRYVLPEGTLRAGPNTIAVRLLDTGGTGGVNGRPEQLRLVRADGATLPLAGEWALRKGAAKGALPPMDGAPVVNSGTPSALWNAMIAPLLPPAALASGSGPFRGAIWYQGESNRYDPELYAALFPAMVRAWRDRLGAELGFHFVQIAPFAYDGDRGQTALLREAQEAALALAGTSMTVTLDVGDRGDIHPREKRVVGERLARSALAAHYGRADDAARAPRFGEVTVEPGRIRVHIDDAVGGLKPGPSGLVGFEVAGADRRFVVADATIEGDTVVVASPQVAEPVAVRYAFSAAPDAALLAGNGLPVPPFRSDRWPRPEGGWRSAGDGGRTRWLSGDSAFTPLFDGRTLAGWTPINCGPSTWSVRDGVIACTGVPTGLLRTDAMHENFELELEWRHLAEQGNAGLFVWSDALTAVGQPFTRAVEVQVMVGSEGDWYTSDGDIFPIHGASMTPENPRGKGSRAFPTEKRMRPAGEWNHYTLTCDRGAIALAVNGKVVTRGRDASPRKGYICLESEGTPVEFRNIRIRPLPATVPALEPAQVATTAQGFVPLYTGVDLSGWKADAETAAHWRPQDWVLAYDGKAGDLWTERAFKDFQMVVDWRLTKKPVEQERPLFGPDGLERPAQEGAPATARVMDAGDSGIYLRGNTKSQVNIWSWPCGSGEVYGYRTDAALPAAVRAACAPSKAADRPPGEWNRFVITMKGDRLTVELNGETVIRDAHLPGVPAEGPIGLQSHGDPIEFANLFVRPL